MMCACVGYGCVCFLWVCGILVHNSCSSQVTAPFSRTYLAFLPRHDYHTPSTPGLATRNISISGTEATFQKWATHPSTATPCLLVFIPHPVSLPPHCLLLIQAPSSTDSCCLAIGILGYNLFFFPPESAVCVCRHGWVIWQWHLITDLLLGYGRKGRKERRRAGEMMERSSYKTLSHYCIIWPWLIRQILRAVY